MTSQVESDQLDLFNLENQVSTGKRLALPSDDAPAALRAIDLQRSLQRNTQYPNEFARAANRCSTTPTQTLQDIATTLNNIKAEAIGVNNTTSTDDQRKAVINEIDARAAITGQIG